MTDRSDKYGIRELEARARHARGMGGEQKIARQHERGRLTARERIELLLDDGEFDELGLLNHSERAEVKDATPADGKITGFGHVDGREVYVSADDATILAGAGGKVGMSKAFRHKARAIEKGIPVVNLGDAGGARMPDIMGSTGLMGSSWPVDHAPRDRRVPMIATIMGECFGLPAWNAAIADIVIQVKGSVYAVGGSSILKIATGELVTDADLGGWELHARTTGAVDLFVDSDEECLQLIRHALSYFPSNAEELPPVTECFDAPDSRLEGVFDIVPSNPRRSYDMHGLISLLADEGSVLELKSEFDGALITALTRIDGHVTGVLANNPAVTAGAMGTGACEKATSFIAMCDSFHIPLLFLQDTPGFLLSKEAEEKKVAVHIMRFIDALHHCSVPRISVIVRKSYGMAHFNMSGASMMSDVLMAWPTADVSFMAPEVAVSVAYGRKLAQSDNPEQDRQVYVEEMKKGSTPWEPAGLNMIDKVIDPRDTRTEVIRALRRCRGRDGKAGMSKRLMRSWPRMC